MTDDPVVPALREFLGWCVQGDEEGSVNLLQVRVFSLKILEGTVRFDGMDVARF